MATTFPVGTPVTVQSPNISDDDRFVASLVSSYGNRLDGIDCPLKAAAAAYALTLDHASDGTMWSVYDRKLDITSTFTQSEFEELALEPGYIT